jgi:hypothetical protein
MHTAQWIGLLGGALLVAFIMFAFRQGMKVKPDPNNRNDGPSVGAPAGPDGQ